MVHICCENIRPGTITPLWVWVMIVFLMTLNIILMERCCYSCDYDDDFTVTGYPCIYPCNKVCY